MRDVEPLVVSGNDYRTSSHAYGRVKDPFLFDVTTKTECPRPDVQWTFGDGKVHRGHSGSHIYSQPGDYTARVKATCSPQCGEMTREVKITAIDAHFADDSGDDAPSKVEISAGVCPETKTLRLVVKPLKYAREFFINWVSTTIRFAGISLRSGCQADKNIS